MEVQRSYYAVALTALRPKEQPTPTGRRFGEAAWHRFEGSLSTADPIERWLRNSDGQWHDALGAPAVRALRAVAEDGSGGRAPLQRVGGA